ncbi:MAG: hypothetical protein ACREYF_05695 [Gammaproteobacteria bacterium]
MDIEAQVLEVIKDLFVRSEKGVLSVKNITGAFINRYGDEYEKTISPKSIGTIIRKRLHVKTQKSQGVFVIPLSEKPKLDLLWERFGIAAENARRSGGKPNDGEGAEMRTAVTARMEKAAPCDETRPDKHYPGKWTKSQVDPDTPKHCNTERKRDQLWHDPLPLYVEFSLFAEGPIRSHLATDSPPSPTQRISHG